MLQAAHPNDTVRIFTEALSDEDAVALKYFMELAVEALRRKIKGMPFGVALRIADDPNVRRHQYQYLMQLIAEHFGPREGENLQSYFDPKLILN